jgi:multidrug efflux pump subunit AcrA (membrane-fusion protein)
VDAVQAGLAVQQQAQAFAKAERLASESAASSAQQSLLAALSLRDQQIANLQRDQTQEISVRSYDDCRRGLGGSGFWRYIPLALLDGLVLHGSGRQIIVAGNCAST